MFIYTDNRADSSGRSDKDFRNSKMANSQKRVKEVKKNSRKDNDLCDTMQHKGEIVEKAVRQSGYPLTKLARKMGKTARWLYYIFENSNVPIDYILEIGNIIHYDFTEEIAELKRFKNANQSNQLIMDTTSPFGARKDEASYWKDKYLQVLESYNEMLLKIAPGEAVPRQKRKYTRRVQK